MNAPMTHINCRGIDFPIAPTFVTQKTCFMLGQGCLMALFGGNNLFPQKVGLRWVFVNGLKWVQKWVKSGFLGAKVGQNASKPTFAPTSNPFRHIHENPLFTQFKGGGNCFPKRALRQFRPSIRLVSESFVK